MVAVTGWATITPTWGRPALSGFAAISARVAPRRRGRKGRSLAAIPAKALSPSASASDSVSGTGSPSPARASPWSTRRMTGRSPNGRRRPAPTLTSSPERAMPWPGASWKKASSGPRPTEAESTSSSSPSTVPGAKARPCSRWRPDRLSCSAVSALSLSARPANGLIRRRQTPGSSGRIGGSMPMTCSSASGRWIFWVTSIGVYAFLSSTSGADGRYPRRPSCRRRPSTARQSP